MAATAAQLVYPYIVKEAGYCGGKAAIGATRVRVMNVVFLWKQGKTMEQILESYPDLTPAQVHAALTYYYDHTDEVEADLRRDEEAFREADRQWQGLVQRHGGQPPESPTGEERHIPRPFTPSSE